MIKQRLSPEQGQELIKLTPQLVKLIVKTIKYSKAVLTKDERRELGSDLTGTCLSGSWRLDRRSNKKTR
jgi:hypothetical protein